MRVQGQGSEHQQKSRQLKKRTSANPVTVLKTLLDPSQFVYQSGITPMTHWSYPATLGLVYMTVILTLRWVMSKTTTRIEARWLAAIHNFNMFAISLACFVGMLYGTIKLGWVRNPGQ